MTLKFNGKAPHPFRQKLAFDKPGRALRPRGLVAANEGLNGSC